MIYAGIGSRETPQLVCNVFLHLATKLSRAGFTLRSGRARGADAAFEYGADCGAVVRKEIFLAIDAARRPDWHDHAKLFHPNWSACSGYARNLHARNSAIMLGADLVSPVAFVVCWTDGGKLKGGTSQALRIADTYGIPVFNFGSPDGENNLNDYLKGRGLTL